MKESRVNLHMSRKGTLFIIVSFSLASVIICLFVALSMKDSLNQLNSLLQSDYLFSAIIGEAEEADAYFQYNAGISFATMADSNTGLNVDIVMQVAGSEYSGAVFWNAEKMSESAVAISRNISKAYGLEVGDCIYSKHVVDGTVHEYTISQVLPNVASVRIQRGRGFTNGIIIMGYDPSYAANVSHTTLLFSSADINVLSKKSSGTLTSIVYREDEIKDIFLRIVPYYVLLIVLSIAETIGTAVILKRAIAYNFKRLVMLGFAQKELNKSLYSLFWGTGIISMVVSFVMSLVVFGIIGLNLNIVVVILLLSVVIVKCITLLLEEAFIKRQLWRQ